MTDTSTAADDAGDAIITRYLRTHGDQRLTVREAYDTFWPLITDLAARITTLEARPAVKYCGVHEAGRTYPAGSLCTRAGSLWCATTDTDAVPGSGPGWQLCVKRGRAE